MTAYRGCQQVAETIDNDELYEHGKLQADTSKKQTTISSQQRPKEVQKYISPQEETGTKKSFYYWPETTLTEGKTLGSVEDHKFILLTILGHRPHSI